MLFVSVAQRPPQPAGDRDRAQAPRPRAHQLVLARLRQRGTLRADPRHRSGQRADLRAARGRRPGTGPRPPARLRARGQRCARRLRFSAVQGQRHGVEPAPVPVAARSGRRRSAAGSKCRCRRRCSMPRSASISARSTATPRSPRRCANGSIGAGPGAPGVPAAHGGDAPAVAAAARAASRGFATERRPDAPIGEPASCTARDSSSMRRASMRLRTARRRPTPPSACGPRGHASAWARMKPTRRCEAFFLVQRLRLRNPGRATGARQARGASTAWSSDASEQDRAAAAEGGLAHRDRTCRAASRSTTRSDDAPHHGAAS